MKSQTFFAYLTTVLTVLFTFASCNSEEPNDNKRMDRETVDLLNSELPTTFDELYNRDLPIGLPLRTYTLSPETGGDVLIFAQVDRYHISGNGCNLQLSYKPSSYSKDGELESYLTKMTVEYPDSDEKTVYDIPGGDLSYLPESICTATQSYDGTNLTFYFRFKENKIRRKRNLIFSFRDLCPSEILDAGFELTECIDDIIIVQLS